MNYPKDGKAARFARNIYRLLTEDHKANQTMAIARARRLLTKVNSSRMVNS
jgi:hypothetical protein